MIYVEDFLQHYVEVVGITDSNKQILESINKQVKKGMALTDRQYDLVMKVMQDKVENFTGDEPLRVPLRTIDRSKYIKIVDHIEKVGQSVYESYKHNWQWIKIRFPFSKKCIIDLESIAAKHRMLYDHQKGSHEHYFKLTESVVKDVCETFLKKDFVIDDKIIDLYQQIKNIDNCPENYVPGYWNNQVKNVDIDTSNLTEYKIVDRKRQLGLSHVDYNSPAGIVGKICNREEQYLLINPKEFSINNLVSGLLELDRFPILALIDSGNELDQMTTIYNAFSNVVSNSEQCALFRVENKENKYNVNNFIHEKSLNNWLDNSIKIVYIKSDKLPKLIIKENWIPQCVLSLSSTRKNNLVVTYVKDVCDLIIDFDEQPNIWRGLRFGQL